MKRLSDERLWWLRNKIPIDAVVDKFDLPSKEADGDFCFLCPRCREFNTAVNPRANLGRCFRCEENYNPIDLVMAVRRCSFLQAVRYLSKHFKIQERNQKESK